MLIADHSLRELNTLGIDASCDYFNEVNTLNELKEALAWAKDNHQKILILGGGSNVLLLNDYFKGLVIHINLKGISTHIVNDNEVIVTVSAGENWHDFVLFCIENNYGGIENLSLIPGSAGASPIQNIGAYGVEIKDVLEEVKALNIETGEIETFKNKDCQFGYRDSFFKKAGKDKYIIIEVSYRLTTNNHQLNLNYGDIKAILEKNKIDNPTIKDVSNAVTEIRKSKLPDPKKIPNAGSFFKNPIISKELLTEIQQTYPDIPHYEMDGGGIKIPAGWLIEKDGWKGIRSPRYGVHPKQALVIVNYGGSTGKDIYKFSENIIKDIFDKFHIKIEREVNIIQ